MWERRNFSDCAIELQEASSCFRAAYLNTDGDDGGRKDELRYRSIQGRDLLDILALTVRREMDDKTITNPKTVVGALKADATVSEQNDILKGYRPPYNRLDRFDKLDLREAFNKIAHAQRHRTSFFVDDMTHDIVLCGDKWNPKNKKMESWIAVISIIELAEVLKELPDVDRPDTFGLPVKRNSPFPH